MIVSSSNAVSISGLAPETYAMLDGLARRHATGKYRVVKAILEAVRRKDAERAVTAYLGRPTPRHRIKYVSGRDDRPRRAVARRQDEICREIHGEIPMGLHCGYPNCRCQIHAEG